MSIGGISSVLSFQHYAGAGATQAAIPVAGGGNDHDGDEINGADPAGESDAAGGGGLIGGALNPALGLHINILA